MNALKTAEERLARREEKIKKFLAGDEPFRYMMLSRLQADCIRYLDYGYSSGVLEPCYLWANDVQDHIAYMEAIYNSLPEAPQWLTSEELDSLKERILNIERE